jgi:15-cis-phytoene synthase
MATSCARSELAPLEPSGNLLTTNLDIVTADVRQRDRDRYLAALYAPAEVRPALIALFGIDAELGAVVAGTTEPMIGEIRLAWWREALEGLDSGTVPAQPLLQLAAAELLPRGIGGAALGGLEDRWLGMIGNSEVPVAHVEGGGVLFGLAARLLGSDEALGRQLGEAWVTGDATGLPQVPSPLRPLLGLVRLAARDVARAGQGPPPEAPGSLGRQWQLLKTIALGR